MNKEAQEALGEFRKLLIEGYYSHDRMKNDAEDYSEKKELRDSQAAMSYADSEEFKTICIGEKLFHE